MHNQNALQNKYQTVQSILSAQRVHEGYAQGPLEKIVQLELEELTLESIRYWTAEPDRQSPTGIPVRLLHDLFHSVHHSPTANDGLDGEDLDEYPEDLRA